MAADEDQVGPASAASGAAGGCRGGCGGGDFGGGGCGGGGCGGGGCGGGCGGDSCADRSSRRGSFGEYGSCSAQGPHSRASCFSPASSLAEEIGSDHVGQQVRRLRSRLEGALGRLKAAVAHAEVDIRARIDVETEPVLRVRCEELRFSGPIRASTAVNKRTAVIGSMLSRKARDAAYGARTSRACECVGVFVRA
eukprot:4220978-Pleurochrysis_carterae.AAC.1